MPTRAEFTIETLGPCEIDSPLASGQTGQLGEEGFVNDDARILVDDHIHTVGQIDDARQVPSLALAGPRRRIFFRPDETCAAVVTCGGLCPGINDVIRGLVMVSHYRYGIKRFLGFRYGYQGLARANSKSVIPLNPQVVSDIHVKGGTMLGSSRGAPPPEEIVDRLVEEQVDILYVIGGDGTLRGGMAIVEEVRRRGLPISVVGVPKTIDNDIEYIDSSFGFNTAVSQALEVIDCAHVEAIGAPNGIGLVKLMGRNSGSVACHATLASSDVNFTLIPEIPFALDGPSGLLACLKHRLQSRHHAVIVVAEGAGQHLFDQESIQRDASGNPKLQDIGTLLAARIKAYCHEQGVELNLKYIDPSYTLRGVPANAADSIYCWRLAQNAVHAAMCGKTGIVVGEYHGRFIHLPMRKAIERSRCVDACGEVWLSVLESTGQPPVIG